MMQIILDSCYILENKRLVKKGVLQKYKAIYFATNIIILKLCSKK